LIGRPRIITDNRSLFQHYEELSPGDIICCRIRLRPDEEHLLLDLSSRGVIGIPSFLSQLCSRSKLFQTRLFASAMLPGTRAVYTIHDLTNILNEYGEDKRTGVIVKLEGKNAGTGVLKFPSIEDVYSQSTLKNLHFPYVVQPFAEMIRDIRVIVIGDYHEAYERSNPHSFRNNLHCGGNAQPVDLTDEQRALCQSIMSRGNFPYGHIDLMIDPDGIGYLGEINLRGGLRGARIAAAEYQRRVKEVEAELLRQLLATDEQV